jgi:adenosyl cobinamide kinase/adenosyl cobinamide phosphate guanylyltransferase
MADEGNSTGRLDRLEALLDKIGERLDKLATSHYLHDERLSRIEALHEENEERWKAWRQEEEVYRREQRERDKVLDERVNNLVSAIGTLIGKLPA